MDDPAAWVQSLPALGHTMNADAVRGALATDPPAVFRTEMLCQHVTSMNEALDGNGWAAGSDPLGSVAAYRGTLAGCVDVSIDGNHVALVVAAQLPDGRVRVEPVASWESTRDARSELPDLLATLGLVELVWFPGGPANALAPVLTTARGLTGNDVTSACMGFVDLVQAGMVVHNANPLLDGQVAKASKLQSGDGFRFTRRGTGNCNALYAAAGAVLAARTAKPKRSKVFVL